MGDILGLKGFSNGSKARFQIEVTQITIQEADCVFIFESRSFT